MEFRENLTPNFFWKLGSFVSAYKCGNVRVQLLSHFFWRILKCAQQIPSKVSKINMKVEKYHWFIFTRINHFTKDDLGLAAKNTATFGPVVNDYWFSLSWRVEAFHIFSFKTLLTYYQKWKVENIFKIWKRVDVSKSACQATRRSRQVDITQCFQQECGTRYMCAIKRAWSFGGRQSNKLYLEITSQNPK